MRKKRSARLANNVHDDLDDLLGAIKGWTVSNSNFSLVNSTGCLVIGKQLLKYMVYIPRNNLLKMFFVKCLLFLKF